jgi:hypothetical protein
VVNTGNELLAVQGDDQRLLCRADDVIAFFDVSQGGRVACILGRPGSWRAVLVESNGKLRDLKTRGAQAALWLDDRQLAIIATKRGGSAGLTRLVLHADGETRDVFQTELLLRGEYVTNGEGGLFLAGATFGGGSAGAWIVDPSEPPPYESIVDVLPVNDGAFLDASTVIFGAHIGGQSAFVIATHEAAVAYPLTEDAPRETALCADSRTLAWARPVERGGCVWAWRVPCAD